MTNAKKKDKPASLWRDLSAAAQDVTGNKKGKILLQRLLESTPDAMIIVDGSGRIVLVNRQTEQMFGYARKELLGQSVEVLIPPRYRSRHEQHVKDYRQAPRVRPMGTVIEIWALRNDGTEFPAEISLGPLETEEGLLILSTHRDITERKQMEQMLREKDAQLLAAQRIQERLLPGAPPNLPGFDIFGVCYPAEFAAGDHYDYLTFPEDGLGVVIGDVVGHGMGSALVMASIHAHLRSLAEICTGIDDILSRANRLLVKGTEEGIFVTMLFARIDPRARTLIYASAGHPTGFLLDKQGEVKAVLGSMSLPLGIFPDAQFSVSDPIALTTGDIALLFTDGLIEATSPDDESFGEARVLEVVRNHRDETARGISEALYLTAVEFADGKKFSDDITLVVLKVEQIPHLG
jgi:sigma-B regulation protein RsbU (phosphoserine phosphatase)